MADLCCFSNYIITNRNMSVNIMYLCQYGAYIMYIHSESLKRADGNMRRQQEVLHHLIIILNLAGSLSSDAQCFILYILEVREMCWIVFSKSRFGEQQEKLSPFRLSNLISLSYFLKINLWNLTWLVIELSSDGDLEPQRENPQLPADVISHQPGESGHGDQLHEIPMPIQMRHWDINCLYFFLL